MNQMQTHIEKAKNDKTLTAQSGELNEKDLAAAAGGWTQNKYNPKRCKGLTERLDSCRAAFLEGDCDHLNRVLAGSSNGVAGNKYNVSCNMGAFPPYVENT